MPEDHKKHLHKSLEEPNDTDEKRQLKESKAEMKEEMTEKPLESDLLQPESIKTFVPDQEEQKEAGDKLEAKGEDQDYTPNFKTTNIDLESQHSLDDLAAETLPQEHPTFQVPPSRTADEGPHIPPLGSRMHPGVVSAHKQSSSGKGMHLIILLLVGLGVIGATVYLLKGGSLNKPTPSPSPVATTVAVESPAPSPSPVVVVDRSKFSIRVLNGTAKSGLAASVSARLKGLGYLADKTGNATNSAFTRTVVRVKSTATGLLEQLISDLQPDFEATSSGTLKDSDSADGEVVIGAK